MAFRFDYSIDVHISDNKPADITCTAYANNDNGATIDLDNRPITTDVEFSDAMNILSALRKGDVNGALGMIKAAILLNKDDKTGKDTGEPAKTEGTTPVKPATTTPDDDIPLPDEPDDDYYENHIPEDDWYLEDDDYWEDWDDDYWEDWCNCDSCQEESQNDYGNEPDEDYGDDDPGYRLITRKDFRKLLTDDNEPLTGKRIQYRYPGAHNNPVTMSGIVLGGDDFRLDDTMFFIETPSGGIRPIVIDDMYSVNEPDMDDKEEQFVAITTEDEDDSDYEDTVTEPAARRESYLKFNIPEDNPTDDDPDDYGKGSDDDNSGATHECDHCKANDDTEDDTDTQYDDEQDPLNTLISGFYNAFIQAYHSND